MDNFFKLLCKQVSRVFCARDVHDIDDTRIDTIANEMHPDIHMFHAGMGVRVMGTSHGTLVVAMKDGGCILWEAEFCK